ncbi:MAG: tetratricopeptide repeat protein [Pirellulales bacterium]
MSYTAAMIADLVELPRSTIRTWQRKGWLVPTGNEHRLAQFDFSEIAVAKTLAQLAAAGLTTARLSKQLETIGKHWPNVTRPLAELSLVASGGQLLVRRASSLAEASGQLRIQYDEESTPTLRLHTGDDADPDTTPSPAALLARDPSQLPRDVSPQQLVEWASELEEAGQLREAAEMYRAAIAASSRAPSKERAELCFQLAEVLYRQGELAAARERYFTAIELDEDHVEARANLGCLLAEQGDLPLATAAFEGALAFHPDYADAHFHLGRLLVRMGRAKQAQAHWQRFLELAPDSPWADEALHELTTAAESADNHE